MQRVRSREMMAPFVRHVDSRMDIDDKFSKMALTR